MRRTICAATAIAVVTAVAWASASGSHHAVARAAAQPSGKLVKQLTAARLATAKYVTNLKRAKADGYMIITKMIPDMGFHFLNPDIKDFDPARPPILVYEKHGGLYQLGALEWVFPEKPAKPPFPGSTYGSFGAACHYVDGTFAFKAAESDCPDKSPDSGAKFNFWHPDLVTLHVWLWYPNPDTLFTGTNAFVSPFNKG
jgi:hypothetical protein